MITVRSHLAAFACAGLALLTTCRGDAAPRGGQQAGTNGQPKMVVVDTDVGPDDWIALLALLRDPDIDLRAVTVAPGYLDCATALSHLRRLEVVAGHPPVPKACGAGAPMDGGRPFPRAWRADAARLLGVEAPPDPEPGRVDEGGVDLLVQTLSEAGRPVTLLTLGALTNVALAVDSFPELPKRVQRLVAMLGTLEAPGNVTAADDPGASGEAEWNARVDPAAAERVLGAGFDLTLVGLDATRQVQVDSAVVARLADGRASRALTFVVGVLRAQAPMIQAGDYQLWDPLAAAEAAHPGVVRTRTAGLEVTDSGPSVGALRANGQRPGVQVSTGADGPAALSWLERTLSARQP